MPVSLTRTVSVWPVCAPGLGTTILRRIGLAGCALDFAVLVFAAWATLLVVLLLEELLPPQPLAIIAIAAAAQESPVKRLMPGVLTVSEKDATFRGFLPGQLAASGQLSSAARRVNG